MSWSARGVDVRTKERSLPLWSGERLFPEPSALLTRVIVCSVGSNPDTPVFAKLHCREKQGPHDALQNDTKGLVPTAVMAMAA